MTPVGDSTGGGSVRCPRASTLERATNKGHRPKNRHPQKRKGKLVFSRPLAPRSSSQGSDVGFALSGLRHLAVPVGRSGWPVLVP